MERVDHEKIIIQDLINLNSKQELDLAPWYQRRSVWTPAQKSYLINTLFEQKPIPTIYVRHSLDMDAEKSIREVVDGQQRLRTILEYTNNEFKARHPAHTGRVTYKDLSRTEQQTFKLTSLSVGYLLGATDEDVIEIFGRLNSVAKTLNEQEKRNANFSGEFKQFCLREAASRLALWRGLGVFSANDIARMNEVQFISDLVLNMLKGLSDYSNSGLNAIYEKYEDRFPERKDVKERLERIFSAIAEMPTSAIKDTVFSRQPLFFTLCVILDGHRGKLKAERIEKGIHKIDEMFNADIPFDERPRAEAAFITACTASTQRIKSRRVRDSYVKGKISF